MDCSSAVLGTVSVFGLAGRAPTQLIDSGELRSMQLELVWRCHRHRHRHSPRQHRLRSTVMRERVEVERKFGMPGRQNRTLILSLRLEQSMLTRALVFENSGCKEVKLLGVESKEHKDWILL